ncbi:MAG: GGDEF domain-containing protein [Terriglobia bacterium]
MSGKGDPAAPAELHGFLKSEYKRIESEGRIVRVALICLAVVLGLGAATFLVPRSLWPHSPLVLTVSPEVVCIVLVILVLLALLLVRYESEARHLRLFTIQQALSAQTDHAARAFDAVTNVFTRNFLQSLLQKEISRAERNGHPLALMMCDVDHFKRVNDRYGHLMGDEILAQIAAILKSCLRGSDHVVRYGGDEFLLILADTDDPGSIIVRDRIVQRVAEWDAVHRAGDVPLSVSLGLYHHVTGQSVDQDLAEVDSRLYAGKHAG